MQYLMMICADDSLGPNPGSPEMNQMMADYQAFTQMVDKLGIRRASERLEDANTATTVRVRNGKVVTTDGPFAETKEQIGGFYLLDCKDLDQAIELAAKIPSAKYGSIEVRPVFNWAGGR
jgi:hypothetical protein